MTRTVARTVSLLGLVPGIATAQWQPQSSGTTASLRGLSVVNDRVVWASGARGTILVTADGGATWQMVPAPGADSLDFRDIEAFNDSVAYVLSIGRGSASRIYKTYDRGSRWELQLTGDTATFYDCIAFWDDLRGKAVSDPVDGRFLLRETDDGGGHWPEVWREWIPPAIPGEAAFAASGSCLVTIGRDWIWLASGGGHEARVYRSGTRGRTWQVASTPIRSSAPSRGIFSIAFADERRGVAVGGDYEAPTDTTANVALTSDGGVTWRLATGRPTGYRSSVAYIPKTAGRAVVAVGTNGSDYSADGGETWTPIDTVGFNTVAFARWGGTAGWAVGSGGRIAKWVGGVRPAVPTERRIRVRKEP